jgi:hypothetical protein
MIFLVIGLKVIVEWELKWSCDAGYINYDNWITYGTREAMNTEQ